MIETFTLIRRHGSRKWEVALGPDRLRREHRRFVKELRATRQHPDFAEVTTALPTRNFDLQRGSKKEQRKPKTVAQTAAQTVKETAQKVVAATKTAGSKLFASRIQKAN